MSNSVHATKAGSKSNGAAGPKLKLTTAGEKKTYAPAKLRAPEGDELLKAVRTDPSAVVTLNNVLDFEDADRWAVLDFVAGAGACPIQVGGARHTDLLEAVLAGLKPGLDLATTRKARLAALEAAVLKYGDALDVACEEIKNRMKGLGYTGVKTADLKKEALAIRDKIAKAVRGAQNTTAVTVKSVLADAPVADDVRVPNGWKVTPAGVCGIGDDGGVRLSAPVLVTGLSRDVQHGNELVTIAWYVAGSWVTATVERKVIANKNTVVDLASRGLPVYSGNAADLVRFLHDYLIENQNRLAATNSSGQMGWQGTGGIDGFLWGRALIPTSEPTETSSGAPAPHVGFQFRGADGGDDQLAAGFHAAGTYEGWLGGIKLIKSYARVRLGFYTAFVPPLLPIYGSENFVLDYSGATSQGKTTTLKVGAGVWGKPERCSGGTALYDWNTTQTWRERAPAVMNHIPLFLDDSKTARHPDEIAQTVYTFTQGRSRGRGTVQGIAPQVGFESVLISSGERPVVSFGEHGGTRARVLTLWGSPFGGTSEQTGQRVVQINGILASNYGHAGPKFVAYLANNRRRWAGYKEHHANWTEVFAEQAGDNPVAGRMAAHFAAVLYTSRLVHQALDLPWEWEDPIAPLYEELTKEAAEADRACAALRHAMSWAVANRNNFFRLALSESEQPHRGWAGRWDRDGEVKQPGPSSKWKYVGFIPNTLDEILEGGGFEADPTVRAWKDRKWLKVTDNRTQFKVKIGRESTWVVAVTRKAVEEVGA